MVCIPGGIGGRWRVELGRVEEVEAVGGEEERQDLLDEGGESRARALVHALHEDPERRLVDVVQGHLALGPLAPAVRAAQQRPQRLTSPTRNISAQYEVKRKRKRKRKES
jgi:hypothetical protein